MPVSLAGISPKPLISGQGRGINALAIADCTALGTPPAAATISIAWVNYGADVVTPVLIDIDLSTYGPSFPIDKVRSCYIDNSTNDTAVYAIFEDTQFVLQCAPFSVAMGPIWTNALKCKLYSSGFSVNLRSTTFQFSNMHVATFSQITSPISSPTRSIIRTAHAFSASTGSPIAFANQSVGPFAASRVLAVVVRTNSVAIVNAANVGISGISNSFQPVLMGANSTDNSAGIFAFIQLQQTFPVTNIIDTISVTLPAHLSCSIDIFAMYNLTNGGNPFDFKKSPNTLMTLNTAVAGVVFYAQARTDFVTNGALGIGPNQDFPGDIGVGPNYLGSGNVAQTTNGSQLFLNNLNQGVSTAQLCASFA